MMSDTTRRTRVLIVGAGPVGLALAIELGHRSIPCRVVERNDRVGYAPRAKTTNVRTREHMRRWGIAGDLRAASPLGLDYPSNVVFCTRLAGHEITRFENAFYCAPGRNPLYAEHAQWIPQYSVEEVMRAHAASLPGVQLCFQNELKGFEQDDRGVRAVVHDKALGHDVAVEAEYLVGCDGARSHVREAIGSRLEGTYGLSRNHNVVFRAPGLDRAHALGPAIMYWQTNAEVPSLLGPMDRGDKWFFMPTKLPDGLKLDSGDAPALIRRATGIDLPYEILSNDEWVASRLLANRYRDRRVFLAGDACHLHPPFGGYGMNMGIADGVDLGWKIAATLQGWGGPQLLDSYTLERRPLHEQVLDEAVANHAMLGNQLRQDGLDDATSRGAQLRATVAAHVQAAKLREFATLGVVKGYQYGDSPVIVPDGEPAVGHDFVNYVPTARPGCLAPHAWLHDGSSLYDHFGAGFTLLAHHDASPAALDQARLQARGAGVPLTLLQPTESGIGRLYPHRYTLVRPDQHVAWCGDALPPTTAGLFERVSGQAGAWQAPASIARGVAA
jgi:2-polyprenyl-6-methoxyphenol hydroxylase-like FAD-dependent oxidoreductase